MLTNFGTFPVKKKRPENVNENVRFETLQYFGKRPKNFQAYQCFKPDVFAIFQTS